MNALARSALFAAIQGKDRQKLWNEKIASAEGVEIFFTGEQFNQDAVSYTHLDVYKRQVQGLMYA